jgi:hypothetical protein
VPGARIVAAPECDLALRDVSDYISDENYSTETGLSRETVIIMLREADCAPVGGQAK